MTLLLGCAPQVQGGLAFAAPDGRASRADSRPPATARRSVRVASTTTAVIDADRDARLSARMAAAQRGDTAAYTLLLRECLPLIASIARRGGVRGEAVEDVVQDTLLTIHRARATYDPARPFVAWLTAIARRRAIDQLRQRGRRQAREAHDPVAYESSPDPGEGAEAGLQRSEQASRVRAWVAGLPPRQREAVDRLALAEESLEQAARSTGRTKVALKVNLHRALKAMRSKLSAGEEDG